MQKEAQADHKNAIHYLSKATIIIPIIVVLVAVILNYKNNGFMASRNQSSLKPTVLPTGTATSQELKIPKTSASSMSLDLQGPYHCIYEAETLSLNAYIKNKNIYAKVTQKSQKEEALLKGDCLYKWKEEASVGEKKCGFSTMVNMVDSLAKLNLVNLDTIINSFSSLGQLPNTAGITPPSLHEASESCKKEEIKDATFEIPKNVTFKETTN